MSGGLAIDRSNENLRDRGQAADTVARAQGLAYVESAFNIAQNTHSPRSTRSDRAAVLQSKRPRSYARRINLCRLNRKFLRLEPRNGAWETDNAIQPESDDAGSCFDRSA